uniref:Uncharacterized protein n=1 Tax=Oryza brachyantha TaxID=4533 RepID=J3LSM0_ORYBR
MSKLRHHVTSLASKAGAWNRSRKYTKKILIKLFCRTSTLGSAWCLRQILHESLLVGMNNRASNCKFATNNLYKSAFGRNLNERKQRKNLNMFFRCNLCALFFLFLLPSKQESEGSVTHRCHGGRPVASVD